MEPLIDRARRLATSKDVGSLVELLTEEATPIEAMEHFDTLAKEAYWDQRNLNQAVRIARAGITAGLALSADADEPYELRSSVKALAFNLASFAWPGWDEEGITIDECHLFEALDAARTNVRLAVELEKGSIAVGRGHWMVGACLLALGRYQDSIAEFLAARLAADEGRSDAESALAEGYAALVRVIERPGDASIEAELNEILDRLRDIDASFAGQIETARSVFAGS